MIPLINRFEPRTTTQSVSVIVPCRNEEAFIAGFLSDVLQQDRADFDLQVIVCDGMSTDRTRSILADFQASQPAGTIEVIDNPQGIVSTGLNNAIRRARGNIIIRMDVHTEYARDYIKTCVAVLQTTGADNVGGPWTAKGEGTWGSGIAAAFQSRFCMGGALGHDPLFEGPVDTVYLGCWKREIFDRVGFFDDGLIRNQDDELNLRIKRAGGLLWQSPRIRAWYHTRGNLHALFRQYLQYGFWKVAVIRKHKLPASVRHLVPGAFVCTVATLPLAALLAQVAGQRHVAAVLISLWAVVVSGYAITCVVCALASVKRHGWRTAWRLPAVFATYHVAYGTGFLLGVLDLCFRSETAPRSEFTSLTR